MPINLGQVCCARHNFITWLALMNRLAVKTRLVRWGVINNSICRLCLSGVETVEYIFFFL